MAQRQSLPTESLSPRDPMSNAYDDEIRRQLRRLPEIRSRTIREILRLLALAEADVLARLAGASPSALLKLRVQQAEIHAAIERFARSADAAMQAALPESWRAGIELVVDPIRAIGGQLGPTLRIDDRALRAMRDFTTARIKDIGVQAINGINGVLGSVLIGTTPMSDAISQVQALLGGSTRRRAMAIAYTNIGQAYSESSYESMLAAERLGVKMAKRWMKSGKQHPRPSHVAAHNQIVRVSEPFQIADAKTGQIELLRFPRDPTASIGNTIQCGCMSVPVLDGSTFGASVIEIPDDPSKPIRKISRAERDQQNAEIVARVNDRLARFLGNTP